MKILILNPILYTPHRHGAAVHRLASIRHTMIYNYGLGFTKLGHEVTLVASEEYKPIENEDYSYEVIFLPNKVKQLIPRFPNGFPILSGLRSYLKKSADKFDMIISSEAFTYHSYVASRIAPEKTIVWQEVGKHVPIMHSIPSKLWHNIVVRYMMRHSRVVPRSEKAKKFIEQYTSNVSLEVVDHGIDVDNFRPCLTKKHYFIVIAQLIARKNIGATIDKFAAFYHNGNTDYALYIYGEGEERERLTWQIKSLGMEDKIHLCGVVNRETLADMMAGAMASLIDTRGDYNMVSIAETIACGTPIITNSVPYSAYYIRNNDLGVVDDNWNEKTMQHIIDNVNEYSARCVAYRKNLSYISLAKKMITIFNEAK